MVATRHEHSEIEMMCRGGRVLVARRRTVVPRCPKFSSVDTKEI